MGFGRIKKLLLVLLLIPVLATAYSSQPVTNTPALPTATAIFSSTATEPRFPHPLQLRVATEYLVETGD